MKYLVEANVLSEPTKSQPDARVLGWLRKNERHFVIDPIVLGELRFGILTLPRGKKRATLEAWFEAGVMRVECVAWDAQTSLRWSELLASLRSKGKAMPIKDSLIAATALRHSLTLVTRNRIDFANCGIEVVEPFQDL